MQEPYCVAIAMASDKRRWLISPVEYRHSSLSTHFTIFRIHLHPLTNYHHQPTPEENPLRVLPLLCRVERGVATLLHSTPL
jgi:hypothetical protein